MADELKVETPATTAEPITESSQIEKEIEREDKKGARTEEEKAAFTLQKNAERLRALGLDPAKVLGFAENEKEKPVTVGMLEQMQKEQASKTALQLAEEIPDEHERELTKKYLARVVPSGDANEDLRFARLAVASVKNAQIAETVSKGTTPKSYASGAGAPPKPVEVQPELTRDELAFTRPPYNMTPAAIIATRSK